MLLLKYHRRIAEVVQRWKDRLLDCNDRECKAHGGRGEGCQTAGPAFISTARDIAFLSALSGGYIRGSWKCRPAKFQNRVYHIAFRLDL